MSNYTDYCEYLDDIEEFAYDRSLSQHRLTKEARRKDRHGTHRRDFFKHHCHRDRWDWGNEHDWDSYDDDSSFEYHEDLSRY